VDLVNSEYSCFLFDLDGTILDSAPGITSCLAYTFATLGLPIPSAAQLRAFVGPPMLESFRVITGLDPAQSREALSVYRAKYLDDGAYDASPFPGIGPLLRRIHASPVPLSLATSKPELPATLMLEHFNLARFFDVITGASADESRSSKADVVGEALLRLEATGADISRPVLVGDRIHDVEGAAVHGVPTIFVTWGYGAAAEHKNAVAVVDSPLKLQTKLFGEH
jgi:phosphoglycolate phosphatase